MHVLIESFEYNAWSGAGRGAGRSLTSRPALAVDKPRVSAVRTAAVRGVIFVLLLL